MKTIQPSLINYSLVSAFYGLARECSSRIFLSSSGIIHSERLICPIHKVPCSYNGSNDSGHIISRSIVSYFKKGQQYCKFCDITYQVESEFIDRIKDDLNSFLKSEILALREIHTTYSDIRKYLKKTKGIIISDTTIEHICTSMLSQYDALELEYEIEDGFYCYDEQWITVNGKKMLRVVILDPKTNLPIYEEKHETLTKKLLEDILKKTFNGKTPKGFVFDMAPMYPNAFTRVFGKRIKLQWCLFHLNQLIFKEYRDSLRIGKRVRWTLCDYYNLYALFNIFYDRTQELNFLTVLLKDLDAYEDALKLNLSDHVCDFPKNCKTDKQKIAYIKRLHEKELMKKFREHLHEEKLRRKREKTTLHARLKKDAKNQLAHIIRQIQYYPKKLQKRIRAIEENFEFFTASECEIMTNNKLEGFFGRTLKKFRKKGFHSDRGLRNFLTFQKINQAGIEIIESISLQRIGTIFSVLALFIR